MTDYQIMLKHLPAAHIKWETPFEEFARYQVRELTMRGQQATYAANPYGTFTVFKW